MYHRVELDFTEMEGEAGLKWELRKLNKGKIIEL